MTGRSTSDTPVDINIASVTAEARRVCVNVHKNNDGSMSKRAIKGAISGSPAMAATFGFKHDRHQHFSEWFDSIDTDHDGRLTVEELKDWLAHHATHPSLHLLVEGKQRGGGGGESEHPSLVDYTAATKEYAKEPTPALSRPSLASPGRAVQKCNAGRRARPEANTPPAALALAASSDSPARGRRSAGGCQCKMIAATASLFTMFLATVHEVSFERVSTVISFNPTGTSLFFLLFLLFLLLL
jgi:hypothetical protein